MKGRGNDRQKRHFSSFLFCIKRSCKWMLQCGSWQPRVCICTALAEVKYLIEHPFLLHWSQLLLKFNLSWSCLPHTRPIPTPWRLKLKAVRICFFLHLSFSLIIFPVSFHSFFHCFERWEHRFLMNGKHLNEGPSTHSYSKLESEIEAGILLSEYVCSSFNI